MNSPLSAEQRKIVIRDGLPFRETSMGELYSCTLLDCGAEIERLQKLYEMAVRGRQEFRQLCRDMLARVEKIP